LDSAARASRKNAFLAPVERSPGGLFSVENLLKTGIYQQTIRRGNKQVFDNSERS